MKKTQNKKNKLITESNSINVGNILYDISSDEETGKLFFVIGVTFNEVGFIRLLRIIDIVPGLGRRFFKLTKGILWTEDVPEFADNVFADLSHIITKKKLSIATMLQDQPKRMLGKIDNQDTEQIIAQIQEANTISKNIKNKYFL